jgi:hypothetical protein
LWVARNTFLGHDTSVHGWKEGRKERKKRRRRRRRNNGSMEDLKVCLQKLVSGMFSEDNVLSAGTTGSQFCSSRVRLKAAPGEFK